MSKPFQYKESHWLALNVFLVFYGYVILIITLANIVPVSTVSYSTFFILGLAGIFILFLRPAYKLTLRDTILEVSIILLVKIVVRRIRLNEAESIEQVCITKLASSFKFKRSARCISCLAKIPTAIKVTMRDKKSYIIVTSDPGRLLHLAGLLNMQDSNPLNPKR